MNTTKVSVIIPVYNVEKYLRQCLDSVVNQTFKDIEIIIVNDCSPDNSLQIIEQYQKKDSRIVLVDLKQNVGLGFARNEGLKVAKGKYVTFIDSDDWVGKDYVRVLYDTVKKYNCDVVSPNFYEYDDITNKFYNGKQPKSLSNIKLSSMQLKQKFLTFEYTHYVRKLFDRDFLIKNELLFRINRLEDILFIWEVIFKTDSYMLINDKLYYYRINRKGSILFEKNKDLYDTIDLFIQLKSLILKKNNTDIYIPVLNSYITNRFAFLFFKSKASYKQDRDLFRTVRRHIFYKNMKFYYADNNMFLKCKFFLYYVCLKYNINFIFVFKLLNKIKITDSLKKIKRKYNDVFYK